MEKYRFLMVAILVILSVSLFLLLFKSFKRRKSAVVIEFDGDITEEQMDDLYVSMFPDEDLLQSTENYKKVFLSGVSFNEGSPEYINKEIHDRIKRLLPLIAPDLTVPVFINHILSEHLERYDKELRVLSETNFKDLIKWKQI